MPFPGADVEGPSDPPAYGEVRERGGRPVDRSNVVCVTLREPIGGDEDVLVRDDADDAVDAVSAAGDNDPDALEQRQCVGADTSRGQLARDRYVEQQHPEEDGQSIVLSHPPEVDRAVRRLGERAGVRPEPLLDAVGGVAGVVEDPSHGGGGIAVIEVRGLAPRHSPRSPVATVVSS